MSMDTQSSNGTETQIETPATKSLSDASLSFSEFEAMRRGETVTAASAPKTAASEAKTLEQKESGKSVAQKTEAKQEDEKESSDDAESEGDESKDKAEELDADEKPKQKKSGFQRRVDKLNAAKAAAQQEAEYWKREALKNATEPKKEQAVNAKAPETSDGKPDPDKYDTHAEFVEALTDWKVDQREKAKEAKEQNTKLKSEVETLTRTYSEKVAEFTKAHQDYADVVSEVDDIPLSATLSQLILKHGPELAYELAKDRKAFESINKLAPIDAALAVGEIRARIASQKASEEKKPEPKKLTQAPKPIEPVGNGKAAVAKTITDPNLSFSDYERLRREQMKRRNG